MQYSLSTPPVFNKHVNYNNDLSTGTSTTVKADGHSSQISVINNGAKTVNYTNIDCQLTTMIMGVRVHNWFIPKLYGSDLWCRDWLEDLCLADPNFLQHLSEQKEGYIHYLCLVRMAWLEKRTPLSSVAQARLLQQHTQKSLLQTLYPSYPNGLLKVLTKFGPIPLSKKYYRLLLTLQRDESACRFLSHAKHLRAYHLRWLEEFPHGVLPISMLHSFKTASQYRTFKTIITVIKALQKNDEHAPTFNSLKRLKTLSQLVNWYQRYVQTLDFPAPPWPGNEWIKPITSSRALKKASKEFQNCIYDYVRSVLLGHAYFYQCSRCPTIVAIKRDPLIGWHIHEINGPKNDKPHVDVVEEIELTFRKADFSTEPDADMELLWVGMDLD